MANRLRQFADRIRTEIELYRRVWRDPRTPRRARLYLALAFAYLALPFDLIPDFIPVIGHLYDLVIIPLLVYLAIRATPPSVIAEHRTALFGEHSAPKR